MSSFPEHQDSNNDSNNDSTSYRELRVLTEVEDCPELTQRDLSNRVGTALGLTNVLLRNLAQKGYIRVTAAGWKRCIYTLTPKGVGRKLQLTLSYVSRVLTQYQNIRRNLSNQLEPLGLNAESRIAIYGTGEFAELAYLGLKDYGIDEIGIFGNGNQSTQRFLGMPVQGLESLRPDHYDRVLVAILDGSSEVRLEIKDRGVEPDKIIVIFGDYSLKESA